MGQRGPQASQNAHTALRIANERARHAAGRRGGFGERSAVAAATLGSVAGWTASCHQRRPCTR